MIKDRIIEFLQYKGINKAEFGRRIGVSSAYITSIRKSIQPDKVERIKAAFPDLNLAWLLTGEGEMLRDDVATALTVRSKDGANMVPLLNLDARGGFGGNDVDGPEYVAQYIPWPDSQPGDFAVEVTGDSMSPNIAPGSRILLRPVPGWSRFVEYNRPYVVELTDDRRLLKVIARSTTPDSLDLLSYNPQYPTQPIPIDMIRRVYSVRSVFIPLLL